LSSRDRTALTAGSSLTSSHTGLGISINLLISRPSRTLTHWFERE
jgi:hypothetical protein